MVFQHVQAWNHLVRLRLFKKRHILQFTCLCQQKLMFFMRCRNCQVRDHCPKWRFNFTKRETTDYFTSWRSRTMFVATKPDIFGQDLVKTGTAGVKGTILMRYKNGCSQQARDRCLRCRLNFSKHEATQYYCYFSRNRPFLQSRCRQHCSGATAKQETTDQDGVSTFPSMKPLNMFLRRHFWSCVCGNKTRYFWQNG